MNKFLKKTTKVALSTLMGVSLAACSSGGNGGTSGSTTGETSYKDTFTFAIGGEPTYLDPAYASDSVTGYVVNQMYYPLFYIGEDGSMVNAACTDYTYDEESMTYTLTIRDDLKWSDGEPNTASDFVYGMKHALSLGPADSYYSYFIADFIENAREHCDNMDDPSEMDDIGITAVDDTTITFKLSTPCPYFISLLSAGVFYPIREDYVKSGYTWADDTSIPTNGPFYPTSIDKASEIVLAKNEYFPDADQVSVNTMTVQVMADMDAQLLAYRSGEIDYATSLDSSVAKSYEGSDELVLASSVINYFSLLNSFGDCEALHDVNVRRALQLGVDRDAIVTALDAPGVYYPLYGIVPEGIPTSTGADFREEADEDHLYCATDKEEAKKLLEEAGYSESNPLKLEYYYNQNTLHDTVAAVLKEQWAEIGVELTLKTGELRTFFDDRTNGLFQIARHAFSADYMDASTFLDIPLTPSQTVHTWGDETYDSMIFESRQLSGEERDAKLHEAEQYLVEEQAYLVPLFGYKSVMLAKEGLTGYVNNPQGNTCFWFVKVPE